MLKIKLSNYHFNEEGIGHRWGKFDIGQVNTDEWVYPAEYVKKNWIAMNSMNLEGVPTKPRKKNLWLLIRKRGIDVPKRMYWVEVE